MHKVFIIQETEQVKCVLDDSYDEILAAVRERRRQAKSLIDDDEYSQLHGLLALIRLGHIRVSNGEDERGVFMMLEIREDGGWDSD